MPIPPPEWKRRAIEQFFEAKSVAVVGASAEPGKWGYLAAEQLLRSPQGREIYLVNRKGTPVLGNTTYRSFSEIEATPELAVVTIPQFAFEEVVDEILDKGTRAIVGITAGFGEESSAGAEIEQRVARRVQASGAVMLGPNCMGVFDGHGGVRCMPWAELPAGPVGFISQSGGLIMDLSKRLAELHLGFSRAVSVGNQADVRISDLIHNLVEDANTRIAAIYCESSLESDELFASIKHMVSSGTPVVLMTPHSSPGSARGARAHTGSQVTDIAAVRAAAHEAGAWHASSPRDMATLLCALVSGNRTTARRVAVVSDTGGPGVLCAGLAELHGLEVPELSVAFQSQLAELLTPRAAVKNPVDLVDNLTVEPTVDTLEALLRSPEVDAVFMNIHVFVHQTPELEVQMGKRLAGLVAKYPKPVVVTSHAMQSPGIKATLAGGVPVFRDSEEAAKGLAAMCGPSGVSLQP